VQREVAPETMQMLLQGVEIGGVVMAAGLAARPA
jgi:hypothetical protein